MDKLLLHDLHKHLGARFIELNGAEAVADYGRPSAEYEALRTTAAVLDFSFRGRLCVLGGDRLRFLHGQVTNDIKGLPRGSGCFAALTTAKGKLQADLNIYVLRDELLLDFEPGLLRLVTGRLEKFIVADDVQLADVSALYALSTVQGPHAAAAVSAVGIFPQLPEKPFAWVTTNAPEFGEIYLANQPRLGTCGFDFFVPAAASEALFGKLLAVLKAVGGGPAGWQTFDAVRIEQGIPRFGVDMDESNFPQECGIESRAISYSKGCYIGQETLNRIHTLGHVNQYLRGFQLAEDLAELPSRGAKLFHAGKEVGYLTSSVDSPALKKRIALGYARRGVSAADNPLWLKIAGGESPVRLVELPFKTE